MVVARRRELIKHTSASSSPTGAAKAWSATISPASDHGVLMGAVQAVMNPPRLAELGLTPNHRLTAII